MRRKNKKFTISASGATKWICKRWTVKQQRPLYRWIERPRFKIVYIPDIIKIQILNSKFSIQ